jgi:hypothetical protein
MDANGENKVDLQYRRQFLLSSEPIHGFEHWTYARLATGWHIKAHPNLEITQTTHAGVELTLIGYIIDPDNAGASNADILATLAAQLETPSDVFQLSSRLCGRWIRKRGVPLSRCLWVSLCLLH